MFHHLVVPLVVLLVISPTITAASPSSEESDADAVFRLLREGNREIRLDENYRDLIILIGNAGAGKTTLGLLMTGDLDDLEAYYDDEADKILIRDKNDRIGSDFVKSKTIFPELMINPENNMAFYDCPGFRDTRRRNASIEFVNTIFLKKITDHARTIKVVMVVNYFSVRKGGTRDDFLNLLTSTLGLLRPIKKFENSVALIATKVEVVRSPQRTVNVIASYLNGFINSIPEVIENEEDQERAKTLLQSLTTTPDGINYPKLYFTRVPSDEGKISGLSDMQADLDGIGRVIYEGIQYVPVTPSDFGYTFTLEASKFIQRLVDKLEISSAEHLIILGQRIREQLTTEYSSQAAAANRKIFAVQLQRVKSRLKIVLNETAESANVTAGGFVTGMLEVVTENGIDLGPSIGVILNSVEEEARLFDLLRGVSEYQLKIDRYRLVKPFQDVIEFLDKILDWYEAMNRIELTLNTYGMPNSQPIDRQPRLISYDSPPDMLAGTWYNLLKTLSQFSRSPFQLNQTDVEAIIGEDIARKQVIELVRHAVDLRSDAISGIVQDLSTTLVDHFENKDWSNFTTELQRAHKTVELLLSKCGDIAPTQISSHIEFNLEGRINQNQSAQQFSPKQNPVSGLTKAVKSIATHEAVLALFGDLVSEEKLMSSCQIFDKLRPFSIFSSSLLRWLSYVDQINGSLRRTNDVTEVKTVQLTPENCQNMFSHLSQHFRRGLPGSAQDAPFNVRFFMRRMNEFTGQACTATESNLRAELTPILSIIARLAKTEKVVGTDLQRLKMDKMNRKQAIDSLLSQVSLSCSAALSGIATTVSRLGERIFDIDIADDCGLLGHIQTAVPGYCQWDANKYVRILDPVRTELKASSDWYDFLIALKSKLMSPEVQQKRKLYNVANISDWGEEGKEQGIFVADENCEDFVAHCCQTFGWFHGGQNAQTMCDMATATEMEHLNEVLRRTLKTQRNCTFENGNVIIQGEILRVSEALDCLHPGQTNKLAVLATSDLLIDIDVKAVEVNRGKTFDLVMIAPIWTSIAKVTIDLSGPSGTPWPVPTEENGVHGNPGKAGGNGGHFVGFAKIVDGEPIAIITNGGNGGPGQNGENGKPGQDGTFCDQACLLGYSVRGHCNEYESQAVIIRSRYGHEHKYHSETKDVFKLHGTQATAGGRGGHGGKGGAGGYPGKIELVITGTNNDTNNATLPFANKVSLKGLDGVDGQAGRNGQGGRQNEFGIEFFKFKTFNKQPWAVRFFTLGIKTGNWHCSVERSYTGSTVVSPSGGTPSGGGRPGGNQQGREIPVQRILNSDEDVAPFVGTFLTKMSQEDLDGNGAIVEFVNELRMFGPLSDKDNVVEFQ